MQSGQSLLHAFYQDLTSVFLSACALFLLLSSLFLSVLMYFCPQLPEIASTPPSPPYQEQIASTHGQRSGMRRDFPATRMHRQAADRPTGFVRCHVLGTDRFWGDVTISAHRQAADWPFSISFVGPTLCPEVIHSP